MKVAELPPPEYQEIKFLRWLEGARAGDVKAMLACLAMIEESQYAVDRRQTPVRVELETPADETAFAVWAKHTLRLYYESVTGNEIIQWIDEVNETVRRIREATDGE